MLSANGLQPMITVEWEKSMEGVVVEMWCGRGLQRLHVGNIPHA